MSDLVRFRLDDGEESELYVETAESNLVASHGGRPDVKVADGGRLKSRLAGVAAAAEQVTGSLRDRLNPDEVCLEFGLKVSGELNWWFLAKQQSEGTIKVTVKWKADPGRDTHVGAEPSEPAESIEHVGPVAVGGESLARQAANRT